VLRSTAAPGGSLGWTRVPKGVSRSVRVKLAHGDTATVRVALHADRGRPGVFEFDATRPEQSLDKPIAAGGKRVEGTTRLEDYGVDAVANTALIMAEDQSVKSGVLRVRYVLTPGDSWIVVRRLVKGVPDTQVGLLSRSAGEYQEVLVPLTSRDLSGDLAVTVHADMGEPGRFNYREGDPLGSQDQPYKSAGVIVSQRVRIK
jgi:hypothetical protein